MRQRVCDTERKRDKETEREAVAERGGCREGQLQRWRQRRTQVGRHSEVHSNAARSKY